MINNLHFLKQSGIAVKTGGQGVTLSIGIEQTCWDKIY